MKKILATIAVALCALTANAQMWVGGSIGFSHTDSDNKNSKSSSTTFNIAPTIGYQLNDKWEVGAELAYSHSASDASNSVVSDKGNTFVIEPFARYNFLKAGIVTFFVDGGVGLDLGKSKSVNEYTVTGGMKTIETTTTQTALNVGFRPGIKFAVSDCVELESHLGFIGYRHSNVKPDSGSGMKTNIFGMDVSGTGLSFGMIFKF